MKALAVTLVAVLAACGPTVIWSGHTADRRQRVEVVADGGLQFVVIDGQRHAAYRGIAGWSVEVAGSHIAFAARVGSQWVVVADGHTSDKWDAIGAIVLSPTGRLAFAGERAGGWHVIVDGVAGPRHEALAAGSLQWSPDGAHVAYVAQDNGRMQAVVDGTAERVFDGIGSFSFTSDGHFAYAARIGDDAFVVHDGVLGPHYGRITNLVIARGHVAYAAFDETAWRVVVDGQAGAAVDKVKRIVMRDDGAHVAWIGRLGEADVLALDGVPIAGGPLLRTDQVAFRPQAPEGAVGLAYVSPVATGGMRVVVDDHAGPVFDDIGPLVWSARGELAYTARRGSATVLVRGDREQPISGEVIGAPVFSSTGGRLGLVVKADRAAHVIVDGHDERFDFVFDDTLVFSADGKRWAVIAGDLAKERLFFALEGGARVPLSTHEVYSAAAQHTEDGGAVLQAWTAAEADRASGSR